MAPNWMATVNILVKESSAMPIREEPMIMCPVDDTGKNSVTPSMMARITDSRMVMGKSCRKTVRQPSWIPFRWTLKDRINFDDETGHHNDRSEGQSQKPEAVLGAFEGHDGETHDQNHDADDHPLIIVLAKRKFAHNDVRKSVQFFQRHPQIFPDRKIGAGHGDYDAGHQQRAGQDQKLFLVVQHFEIRHLLLRVVRHQPDNP